MIVYKVDKTSHDKTNAQIHDMASVLAEISPTLEVLQELLYQQKAAFSSPSFDAFRNELQETVAEAINITKTISEHTQKLAGVSDDAARHLLTVEEHFGAILRRMSHTSQPQN